MAALIKEEKVAITIKPTNGLAALKKLGVKPQFVTGLEENKVNVKLSASMFAFEKGNATAAVTVTLDTLHALNSGTLSAGNKALLKSKVEVAIAEIIAADGGPAEGTLIPSDPLVDVIGQAVTGKGALGSLPPLSTVTQVGVDLAKEPVASGPAPKSKSDWSIFDLKSLDTAPVVKLRDAKQMYQPVRGSSAHSRYFVVAGSKDVRVAARLSGPTLSVRIEGPGWNKHQAVIEGIGFAANSAKGYASLHLAVGDDLVMANKTMGALLLGLGLPMETPIPNLKTIQGKGA